MNIKTQMAFFDRRNPLTIHRQLRNNSQPRQTAQSQEKNHKNNLQINYHNISSQVLDIPDIFSHSIEKHKNVNLSSYNKKLIIKPKKSQEKDIKKRIINQKDFFNFPTNNNFSLSNINYYKNKRNKKETLTNSISMNEKSGILKDIKNNYQIKNIKITKSRNKDINNSTSLPKIKNKRNPLSKTIIDAEKGKENKFQTEKDKEEKDKRSSSQRIINTNKINNIIDFKSKILLKFNHNNNKKISLEEILSESYPFYQSAKYSENPYDKIRSYGVNTYRGTVRQYNEDRVTILIDASVNKNSNLKKFFQKISFFSIYDGHAGDRCSEYLKSYLHQYIFDSEFFPQNPIKAIEQGFKNCENNLLNSINTQNEFIVSSGSCAIIVLIINDLCYIANLGDSRALYSFDSGKKFYQLSRDHKPSDSIEKKRIYKAGGYIYKSNLQQVSDNSINGFQSKESITNLPFRIFPGRLSVSYFLIL